MIHPHLLDRQETHVRFSNEAKAVASISHENVIKVFDYGETQGKRYIVMEYIEGFSLLELLQKYTVIPNLVLIEILHQILSGLAVVHEKGIIHRDIKPANIMIDCHGGIRIMDFGIAFLVNQTSITMTGTFIGSPAHISPEQAEGIKVTDKTDIFSLGSLAYESATGKHPFSAENPQATIHRVLSLQALPPFQKNEKVLVWLSDFIEPMLVKDASQRPSARECVHIMEEKCRAEGLAPGRQRIIDFMTEGED
jgi:serine/threonine-protein kinase